MPSSKSRHPSEMQKKILLHFMEEERNLLNATFSSDFTYGVAKQKWLKIANHLNCLRGAHKNWNQWRRTWHDLKQHVKKRRLLHPKGTLTEVDEKLLGLLEEYQNKPDNLKMKSNAALETLEEPLKEEVIFVEFVKSQSDDEEPEETENSPQAVDAELKLDTSDEERKENPEHHASKKGFRKQSTIAEKIFRLKKSYYMKKLLIRQLYYQERIKIDQKNAESKERIACALSKCTNKTFF